MNRGTPKIAQYWEMYQPYRVLVFYWSLVAITLWAVLCSTAALLGQLPWDWNGYAYIASPILLWEVFLLNCSDAKNRYLLAYTAVFIEEYVPVDIVDKFLEDRERAMNEDQ